LSVLQDLGDKITRKSPFYWPMLAGVIALCILSLSHPLVQGASAGCHLSVAFELLQGFRIYQDVITNLQPNQVWLYVLPASVARFWHLNPCTCVNFMVIGLIVFDLFIWYRLVLRRSISRLNLPIWIANLAICLQLICLILRPEYLSAPDTISLVLLEPYLFLSWIQDRRCRVLSKYSLMTCALAGAGIVFNPFVLAIIIACELLSRDNKDRYIKLAISTAFFALIFLAFVPCFSFDLYQIIMRSFINRILEFEPVLAYMDKSPDGRPLIYFMVASMVLSLPRLRQSKVIAIGLIMATLGFLRYILSVYMLSDHAIVMLAGSIIALSAAAVHYARALKIHCDPWRFSIVSITVLLCAAGLAIARCGPFYGDSDLAIFSKNILEETREKQVVWSLSTQDRPLHPLAAQTMRRTGLLAQSQVLADLDYYIERKAPAPTDPVVLLQMAYLQRMSTQLSEHDRDKDSPVYILLEDGSMQDYAKNKGLSALIDADYLSAGYLSLADKINTGRHPPFEYWGFRTGFSAYRLKPQGGGGK